MYLSSIMAAPPFRTKKMKYLCSKCCDADQRGRWKAGRSPITPKKRGVSLEHGPACQFRTASDGTTALGRSQARRRTAVSSRSPVWDRAAAHYKALGGAAIN